MGFTPATMGQVGLIGQIGGMATGAVGSYFSAQTQKTNMETQAYLAGVNAKMAEISAQSELNRGQKEVGRLTLQAGQLKSRQRASMAANGIDLGVGNAAEVLASTDIMKETDALTIQDNATRSAIAQRAQAGNFENQAIVARGAAGAISPFSSMAGSLLGSAGQVASSWYTLNKNGMLQDSWMELK
jgi:hypothetical protein